MKTIYRKRENGVVRHIIWLVMLVIFLFTVARGDHSVDVPYIRKKFVWDNIEQFNTWYGIVSEKAKVMSPPGTKNNFSSSMMPLQLGLIFSAFSSLHF